MNSNRKRNLKKLARNIITATALYGTVNGPGIQATEATGKPGISGSSVLTGLSMLLGCGVIAGAGYMANKKKSEVDDEYYKKSLELQKKQAEESLKNSDNVKLLNENGIAQNRLVNIITTINTIKRDNKSQKYITADDFYACLKEAGGLTKNLITVLNANHDNVDDMKKGIVDEVTKFFAIDEPPMQPLEEAVNVLTSGISDISNLTNSLLAVSAGANDDADSDNWEWKNNTVRNSQVVYNDNNETINCTGTTDFSFMQANYKAGDKLIPPALRKLLEDTLWCGIGSATPRHNNEGQVLWKQAARDLHETILTSVRTNDAARATVSKGNLPLYLVVSCAPNQRSDIGKLADNYFRVIPLFKNGTQKLGTKEAPNLKEKIGSFICKLSGAKPKSDREMSMEAFQ